MIQKIGILGGSFNPVHKTHILIAEEAARARGLSQVLLVPAATQPFKKDDSLASFEHRMAMLRLACEGHPLLVPDDMEGRRGGLSYTIDTVQEVLHRWPKAEIWFILGSDNLPELPQWRQANRLFKLCRFAVIPRPTDPEADWRAFERQAGSDLTFRMRRDALDLAPDPVSATKVRRRTAAKLDLSALVPPAVAEYIREHELYKTPKGSPAPAPAKPTTPKPVKPARKRRS